MIQIEGIWWPDDVGESWRHSLRHVGSIEWAIAHCRLTRTAVQAGGNIGLWPRRLAQDFARVITFEPEPRSRACLLMNVPENVIVLPMALGASPGVCSIDARGLGSHSVTPGDDIEVTTVDALGLHDVDLLQLDIEGYECQALRGAYETLQRCRPLVQVELRSFTERYGDTDDDLRQLLKELGYVQVAKQPGSDFVFECQS